MHLDLDGSEGKSARFSGERIARKVHLAQQLRLVFFFVALSTAEVFQAANECNRTQFIVSRQSPSPGSRAFQSVTTESGQRNATEEKHR